MPLNNFLVLCNSGVEISGLHHKLERQKLLLSTVVHTTLLWLRYTASLLTNLFTDISQIFALITLSNIPCRWTSIVLEWCCGKLLRVSIQCGDREGSQGNSIQLASNALFLKFIFGVKT